MDEDQKKILGKIANTIRQLSMDAVQKANSGHPGMPMGCAELGAYLYGKHMNMQPKNPKWLGRDRLVLSAGHGSMWLYSCLHLSGYDLSLDEIKRFRQLHSITPGHPEFHETPGVESTTGPLGQGIGNAVGQALGLKILEQKFNTSTHKIFANKVFCLPGDGCLMEGISHEACGLAGHLNLNNLVLIFDSNHITLDGPLAQSDSEDMRKRFEGYNWNVLEIDGHNFEEIEKVLSQLKEKQDRPTLVIAHTIIGKGSPNKAGTHKAHGSPLGPDEVALAKKELGLPAEDFYIPQQVTTYFETKLAKDKENEAKWNALLDEWKKANPDLAKEFEAMLARDLPADLEAQINALEIEAPISGRKASQAVIQHLGKTLPFLYGGSADLSSSDCTMMKDYPLIEPNDFKGRNIKYGIREFGMAAAAAGLFQTQMIFPYVGTFLTFSDYMRNAIRLASLSKYHVIYQFTHDSVFLGEDGPTHQPIEHVAALRAMPNLHVIRPADSYEVRGAWLAALRYQGPTALIFTRQNLPDLDGSKCGYENGVGRGAYILHKEKQKLDFTIFATGSEVSLAVDVAKALEKTGKHVRVVSMPCWEIFDEQDDAYKESVVGGELGVRVSIEAGTSFGWHRWIGHDGIAICMEGFGLSAPAGDLANEFGFTVDAILSRLLKG